MIKLLQESHVPIYGKHIVVIGKSNIVGKPLSLLLMNEGGTVTVCHKDTQDIEVFTKHADIVILAAGCP